MIWKKPQTQASSSSQPTQSQSISGSVNGSTVQMGQSAGNGDFLQSQRAENQAIQQGMTDQDLVALLNQLESAVKMSGLSIEQREEVLDYVRPAKREVGKEVPNRELVGQNLKQASETMQTLRETTEAGKALWNTGVSIFKAIALLLGIPVF